MGLGESICAVSVYGDSLVFPSGVLESKLKVQLIEMKVPLLKDCAQIVSPILGHHFCPRIFHLG